MYLLPFFSFLSTFIFSLLPFISVRLLFHFLSTYFLHCFLRYLFLCSCFVFLLHSVYISHVLSLDLFAAYSFCFSSPLFIPFPNLPPLRWLYPKSKNRANRTVTLLEKGGVSRTMARPFIGCHSHIHATCNSVQTSIIGKHDLR